jgi:hypothetical protein
MGGTAGRRSRLLFGPTSDKRGRTQVKYPEDKAVLRVKAALYRDQKRMNKV